MDLKSTPPPKRAVVPVQRAKISLAMRPALAAAGPGAPATAATPQPAVVPRATHKGTSRAVSKTIAKRLKAIKRFNHRHPNFHSVGPVMAAALVLAVFGVFHLFSHNFYQLSPASQTLIGPVTPSLTKKLTYDAKQQRYQYNKQAESAGQPNSPQAALAAAGNSHKVGGGADNYAVDLPAEADKGITVHDTTDTSGDMAVSLTPLFKTRDGKLLDGRVIYPIKGHNGQLVYSVKGNGLKEDLVIPAEQGDTASFSYQLKLPADLEARQQTDGSIGIYSADSALFGNISYGTPADQQKVEAARKNGTKNHLVFVIPAPQITQTGKGSQAAKASFNLTGDTLTVKATGLAQASYPLSIDPSIAVLSASTFNKGNYEGGISLNGSNQLTRSSLSGGTVSGGWTTDSGGNFTSGRYGLGTVAYNGYLYIMGGFDGSGDYNDVQYAAINSDGSIGSWSSTASFSTNRGYLGAVAYNGYLYIMGGITNGGTYLNDVQYAQINSNGTIRSWSSTTSFTTARYGFGVAAYNGYLYIAGGYHAASDTACNGTASNNCSDVQYVSIKADGTVGTWAATTSFTTARAHFKTVAYNGYLYVIGGLADSGKLNDVQYVSIKADGTVGTWATTNSFTTARYGLNAVAYNGYLYVMGGNFGSGPNNLNDVQYAVINANGTVGTWTATASFSTARRLFGSIAYNGYLYVIGGTDGAGLNANDTQYAQIDPAGVTGGYTASGNTFANASFGSTTVAYNGYLYVIGGCSAGNCTTVENKVRYAAINSDGTIGTFTTSANNLVGARYGHASFAYNGRLYVVGGCSSTTTTCSTFNNDVQYSGTITTGNPAAWTDDTTNPFTTGRFWHSAVVNNGYVYVMGGCSAGDCTNQLKDVQYATINSGGDIGSYSNFGDFDSTGRYKIAAVANGNYLYVTGGYDGSSFKQDVRYAAINTSTGGISGSWGDAGNTFTTARAAHSAVAYNGYLYIVGGCSSSISSCTFQGDTQYAPFNANGTIGSFSTATSLNTARFGAGAAAYNGYLYAAGGCSVGNCTTFKADVEIAPINNGGPGTLSSWTTNANSLAANRSAGAGVAYKGYLYELGGDDGTNFVSYAAINSNGTVGTWSNTTAFINTGARQYPGAFAYNGYMYLMGGVTTSTIYNDVQYAPINSNGTLGTWHYTHNSTDDNTTFVAGFTNGRYAHSTVLYNGYAYILGGCTNYNNITVTCNTFANDVQYAPLNANGTIGSWSSTNGFTTARGHQTAVAANGYMYILGGCTSYNLAACGSTSYLNDVQYAPINSNGTVGTWNNTTNFPTARFVHSTVVANGYMYLIGGLSSGGTLGDTQVAPINANGTLGTWLASPNALPTVRFNMSTTFYNGYIYSVGGNNGGGSTYADVLIAGQQAIPHVANYSYLSDLSGDAVIQKLLYNGTLEAGSQITFNYENATNASPSFGSATKVYTLTPGSLYNFTASEKRYYWLQYTLDDSQSAVFPDSLSTPSTINNFQLWFHAAPTKRLRGGMTFTGQGLSGLDTTPN